MIKVTISALLVVVFLGGAFFYFNREAEAPNEDENNENTSKSDENVSDNAEISEQDSKILAILKTAKGDIELELYPEIAPKTVENFVKLSKNNFYNGIKFHRVIAGFVIQGGDPLSKTDDPMVGTGRPGYVFEDEINPRSLGLSDLEISNLESEGYEYNYDLESLPIKVGALAMANSGPNTNGSQFFIVTEKDQPHLNGKHTVFGRVVTGMDVVLKIEQGDAIQSITFLDAK